jgi:hypothetical protein
MAFKPLILLLVLVIADVTPAAPRTSLREA